MTPFKLLILMAMTMIGSAASLFLKRTSTAEGLLGYIKSPFIYLGGFFYLVAALINIYILRVLDYSVVLPLTSMTYIWTMLLSHFVLSEKITLCKILGVAAIAIGAVFISL